MSEKERKEKIPDGYKTNDIQTHTQRREKERMTERVH